jgi:hypothetical protein
VKPATVKVEYTCGLTLTDRVTLDGRTGEILLPPRLIAVMAKMEESECSPAFSLRHEGYVLPVHGGPQGTYNVQMPVKLHLEFDACFIRLHSRRRTSVSKTVGFYILFRQRLSSARSAISIPRRSGIYRRF